MAKRSAQQTQLITRIVIGMAVVVALAGAWLYLTLAGKQTEQAAYKAVLAGRTCLSVARPPAYATEATLKTANFGGGTFRYMRGDVDCQVTRPGRMSGDADQPYCVFDRPGYVDVQTGSAHAHYVVPFGQASVLLAPGGPHCAIQPSP